MPTPFSSDDDSGLSQVTGAVNRFGAGPSLLGLAVALFVLTRIIIWLPLGFLGTMVNWLIWPLVVLCALAGGFLTWRKSKSDS